MPCAASTHAWSHRALRPVRCVPCVVALRHITRVITIVPCHDLYVRPCEVAEGIQTALRSKLSLITRYDEQATHNTQHNARRTQHTQDATRPYHHTQCSPYSTHSILMLTIPFNLCLPNFFYFPPFCTLPNRVEEWTLGSHFSTSSLYAYFLLSLLFLIPYINTSFSETPSNIIR